MNKQQFLKKLAEIIPPDAELCGFFAELVDPTHATEVSNRGGQNVRTLTSNQNMAFKIEFTCACNFDAFDVIKRELKNSC